MTQISIRGKLVNGLVSPDEVGGGDSVFSQNQSVMKLTMVCRTVRLCAAFYFEQRGRELKFVFGETGRSGMDDCGCGGEGTGGWRDGQKREEGDRKKGVSEGTGGALTSVQGYSCPSCPQCLQGLEGASGVRRAMAMALGSLSGRSMGRRAGGR